MAIAFVDSNTTVNAISGTSHTLTLPSFSPGDVIVAACAVNNSLSGLTLPSGWQRLSGAAPLTMVVVMRVMQSGDAGTIVFTTDVPRTSTLVGLSFSGVDSTHPLDASGGMVSVAGLNAAALLHPGVTTLTTNAMQVYFLGQPSLAPTWATPTGATEVEDSGGVAAGYQARASAGATGTITSQPSAFNTSADYVSFVMALRESGASQGASPVVMPPIFADASDTTLGTDIKQWTKNATGTTWSSGVPGGNVYSVSDPVRTATPSGNAESGMGLGPGLNLAEQIDVDLEATPVDFASMASLSIRYSTVSIGPYGDDTGRWAILILNAAGTTCLAGFSNGTAVATNGLVCDRFDGANWSSTTQGATGTAPAYNKTNAFDFVNTTATKADWDGAFARLYFLDSRNMGSDAASIVLVEFQLEGTYTKSGANITRTLTDGVGVTDTRAPAKAVAQVVTDTIGITDTPVDDLSTANDQRTVTDPIGLTDTAVRGLAMARAPPDDIGITDSVVAAKSISVTITDAIGVTDVGTTLHWSLYSDGVSASTGASVSGLDPLLSYYFYVLAVNSEGNSDPSNIAGPCAPAGGENLTDVIGITDSLTVAKSITVSIADSIGVADSEAAAKAISVTIVDSIGITDTVVALVETLAVVTDPVGITDSVTAAVALARGPPADPVGITDSVTAVKTIAVTIDDLIGITDSATDAASLSATITDPVGITDVVDRVHVASRTVTDTVGLSDTIELIDDDSATETDAVGITDTAVRTLDAQRTITDDVGITDDVVPAKTIAVTIDDLVGIADSASAAKAVGFVLDDPVGISDTAARTLDISRTLTNPIGIDDAAVGTFEGDEQRSITDNVGITDAVARVVDAVRSITDPVGLADATLAAKSIAVTVTDGIGITDTQTTARSIVAAITDPVGLVDTVVEEGSGADSATLTDQVSITDSLARTHDAVRSPTDAIGVTDTVVTARAIAVTITDGVGVVDTASGYETSALTRTATDPIGITDTVVVVRSMQVTIDDGVGIDDTAVGVQESGEGVGITDNIVVALDMVRTIVDPIGITDDAFQDDITIASVEVELLVPTVSISVGVPTVTLRIGAPSVKIVVL